ncbi:hypothetical protein KC352_g22937, partial [Hortaea werneckii]
MQLLATTLALALAANALPLQDINGVDATTGNIIDDIDVEGDGNVSGVNANVGDVLSHVGVDKRALEGTTNTVSNLDIAIDRLLGKMTKRDGDVEGVEAEAGKVLSEINLLQRDVKGVDVKLGDVLSKVDAIN